MRNTCPSCQTLYVVTPRDVGRRIACRKCQAILIIDEQGLRYENPPLLPSPAPEVEKPAEAPADAAKLSRRKLPAVGPFLSQAAAYVPGLAGLYPYWFGIGAVLVIFFLFMPMIGKARVDRVHGTLEDEKVELDLQIKRLREKAGNEERIRQLEEKWSRRREDLELEGKLAEIAIKRGFYIDRYGLLLGFMTLAIGSISYLNPDQPAMKRIVGAIVITAQMLIVFILFVIRG